MSDPNWSDVHQREVARKVERWKKIRQDTGQQISDRAIEKHVERTQREATERVIRGNLHKPNDQR